MTPEPTCDELKTKKNQLHRPGLTPKATEDNVIVLNSTNLGLRHLQRRLAFTESLSLPESAILGVWRPQSATWKNWEDTKLSESPNPGPRIDDEVLSEWHRRWGHPEDSRLIIALAARLGYSTRHLQSLVSLLW